MLTEDEKLFIDYWEKNRDRQKQAWRLFAMGLPSGLFFALPVLLAVIFHDWYKNMIYISNTQLLIIAGTVFFIAIFYGIFKMKFKWENNEQLYKELKYKEKKLNAANQ